MADATMGSAEWWRDRLVKELVARQAKVKLLEDYYRGEHPLPTPPKRLKPSVMAEARRAYSHLMRLGVTNWVKLVADAPSERLEVIGFRFGKPDTTQDADQAAWRIWQANSLDADSALVHDNALQTGTSFVLIDPFVAEGQAPLITCEHSAQMIVAYQPGSRRRRAAALKLWSDESGMFMATLYLPGLIYKWQTKSLPTSWVERRPTGEEWPLTNPLGAVPVVEFRANPSLKAAPYGGGYGEFESVLSIQDRINKTIFDRLVTAEFQAFRQRWAIGWSPETDEATGLPREDQIFKASQAFLWTFAADPAEVKVGEFGQADFTQFIKATETDVNAMAAISKTPPHYLLGAMVNISGDGIVAAESGLTSKSRKHGRNFGESWEEVMRLALAATGSPHATDLSSQIIWADFERRTWGEQVDAVSKMGADPINVPREALWSMLPGVKPQDMARWTAMNEAEQLLNPPPDPVPANGPQPVPTV